ncbi:PUTATIVE TWO-COMPONENT SENSOR [hydrothermal vent metagenome]|uniref:PUTATIVE TWO-COMPONENT SENSOR n=1 Tax=hydrothermal vent metagenome TaxID=652676 RepID=A0A1W1E9E6_9ZZZZ
MSYIEKLQSLYAHVSNIDDPSCHIVAKELQEIIALAQKNNKRINRIITQSDRQQMAIVRLNEELDAYKNHLEKKVEEELQKRKEQENLLIEQSRLAAIAEMIDAVAHQWKQPLNLISMRSYLLLNDVQKHPCVSLSTVTDFYENISQQIQHMSETLDNFRSFFRPIENAITFSVKSAVDSILELIRDDLYKHSIETTLHLREDFTLTGNSNEFKHIILNLISNAKDAFEQNGIMPRHITITIDAKTDSIEVEDNAGGIPHEVIEKIFDMHVTTKEKQGGSGVGLYLSQQIALKHNGRLYVENTKNGAKFTFSLKDTHDHHQ